MTTTISSQAVAARENARDKSNGKFGEQHLSDPGTDVLGQNTTAPAAALLCGRCGCPVYEDHGSFVDETGGDGCDDDVHTGHRYDTPEVDELRAGDRIIMDGVAATVRNVQPDPNDPEGRFLTYFPDDYVEDDSDYLDAGARVFRLTSPSLTPYPINSALGDYGIGGLICGRCGEPVIDWRGTWVDESKSTRCGSGRHASHHVGVNSQVVGADELRDGDTLILDGERVIVASVDNDHKSTSVEFRFDSPFDDSTHIRSFGNDELFDRVTSGPLPATTIVPEGPDEHRFGTNQMIRAERALDGADPSGDGQAVREAAAVVNLMRARRLADQARLQYPTAEQVVLEPSHGETSNDLQVAGIVLADGSIVTREQIGHTSQGALNTLDGEACRLGEDGGDDWIRTCSESARGHRHVMQLFEASRIDRIDLDRGTYDPARYDRR